MSVIGLSEATLFLNTESGQMYRYRNTKLVNNVDSEMLTRGETFFPRKIPTRQVEGGNSTRPSRFNRRKIFFYRSSSDL